MPGPSSRTSTGGGGLLTITAGGTSAGGGAATGGLFCGGFTTTCVDGAAACGGGGGRSVVTVVVTGASAGRVKSKIAAARRFLFSMAQNLARESSSTSHGRPLPACRGRRPDERSADRVVCGHAELPRCALTRSPDGLRA